MIAARALFVATVTALNNPGHVWGNRVYLRMAPAGAALPYCVITPTGGGDDNARAGKKTANIVLQVTCWGEDSEECFTGAAQIDGALDDQGEQEGNTVTAALNGWHITTITAVGDVFNQEMFADARPLYQIGKEYRFIMEEI